MALVDSIQNIFRIPELRRRLLFTLGMFAIYRLGEHIPAPGVNGQALAAMFAGQKERHGVDQVEEEREADAAPDQPELEVEEVLPRRGGEGQGEDAPQHGPQDGGRAGGAQWGAPPGAWSGKPQDPPLAACCSTIQSISTRWATT